MSREIVGDHMSAAPLSIQRDETLSAAHRAMR